MKTVKITVEFEVPDNFDDREALARFVNGTMDNAPEPEDIDEALKDISVGLVY